MIKQFKKLIEKVIAKPIEEEKIECAIDENIVDCESDAFKQDAINYYTGVPAPAYLSDDDWFGGAPSLTEKQIDYMAQETEIKMVEEQQRSEETCESHDIHVKMYEIATKNWTTVAETQGGSENFQEGPGGWNSGTGWGKVQK